MQEIQSVYSQISRLWRAMKPFLLLWWERHYDELTAEQREFIKVHQLHGLEWTLYTQDVEILKGYK